jgi:arsenate reductase
MDKTVRVLFVCGQNTARSQMAEAFLNEFGKGRFKAESAGLEAGSGINPLAAAAMKEIGIDISGNKVKKVFDLFTAGKTYQYVIAVCDKAKADRCPIFPGMLVERLDWPFDDPASLSGSEDEKLDGARRIREEIKGKVEEFIKTISS